MIRLVVSNPNFQPKPDPHRQSPSKVARIRAEREYVREHRYVSAVELEDMPGLGASIVIVPDGPSWTLRYESKPHPTYAVKDFVAGFPSRIAAYDHGIASIRRVANAAAPYFPENAAVIVRWLDSLEEPK